MPAMDSSAPGVRVSTTDPDKVAAVAGGASTAPGTTAIPEPERLTQPSEPDRFETYQQEAPNGSLVTVRHNLDTGESVVVDHDLGGDAA